METEKKSRELKHLGFVRVAAIQALLCFSNLYDYAKQNSGPLKSTVGTVEGAVTAVLSPVCKKFKGVPDDFLIFLDKKVDEASHKFDEHAPPLAKQVVSQAHSLIQKASQKSENFVKEARTGGPRAAFNWAAAEYKEFLLTNSMKAWVKLNNYQPIHTVAGKTITTAEQLSDKYNHLVKDMTQKGYPVVGYLPLVPVDEIAKAYNKQGEALKKEDADVNESSSDSASGSD